MAEGVLRSLFQTVDALCTAIESRDLRTAGHHQRTADLCRRIAQALALDRHAIEGVRIGAMLHDVGKNGVPFEILGKPGKLSADEMTLVRNHVAIGVNILKRIDFPWPVLDIAAQHHERLDGSGYPNGLRGDAIRIESRIVAVADSVDAMLSNRAYRGARSIDFVIGELEDGRGRTYDAEVVNACVSILREPGFAEDAESGYTLPGAER